MWTAVLAVRAAGGPGVGAAAHPLALGQQAARLRFLTCITQPLLCVPICAKPPNFADF